MRRRADCQVLENRVGERAAFGDLLCDFDNPCYLSQDDSQIGHSMPANGTAINLEGANDAHKTGIDLLLAAFGEQHLGGQLAPGQAALEGFAHHVRVAAQSLATVLAPAHHRIQVLIPEQGELTEGVQPTLDQSPDEREIDLGTAIADLAVFVQVEDADVGQLGRLQPFVKVAGDPFQVGPTLPEAVDPGRVEVDADKAAGRQDSFAFRAGRGSASRSRPSVRTSRSAAGCGRRLPRAERRPRAGRGGCLPGRPFSRGCRRRRTGGRKGKSFSRFLQRDRGCSRLYPASRFVFFACRQDHIRRAPDRVLRLWRSTLYPKLVMVDQVVRREDSGRKQFYVKWRNITTGQLVGLKADQLDSYSEEGRP